MASKKDGRVADRNPLPELEGPALPDPVLADGGRTFKVPPPVHEEYQKAGIPLPGDGAPGQPAGGILPAATRESVSPELIGQRVMDAANVPARPDAGGPPVQAVNPPTPAPTTAAAKARAKANRTTHPALVTANRIDRMLSELPPASVTWIMGFLNAHHGPQAAPTHVPQSRHMSAINGVRDAGGAAVNAAERLARVGGLGDQDDAA